MSDEIYFSGDPATDSARRHLERVLYGPQRQRVGWVAAVMAGATALTLWKVRRNRRARQEEAAAADAARSAGEPPATSS
jgi:hypothetical protein